MSDRTETLHACAVTAVVVFFFTFMFAGKAGIDFGWELAYRAMKAGTIEKEMQQRAPALWIELNTKKAEK